MPVIPPMAAWHKLPPRPHLSFPAKAGNPVRRGLTARQWPPRRTGSSASAEDDSGVCGTLLAPISVIASAAKLGIHHAAATRLNDHRLGVLGSSASAEDDSGMW